MFVGLRGSMIQGAMERRQARAPRPLVPPPGPASCLLLEA